MTDDGAHPRAQPAGGLPASADEARAVLRMWWLAWLGGVMGVVCLMLAVSSFQIGRSEGSAAIQWGAPVFFGFIALMWTAGIRRLRARLAVAREILAREPGA